jgi:hypothetical protein
MVGTISTLLAALQSSIGLPGAAPMEQQYTDLLNHPQAIHQVSIATSRVPDFTLDGIQNPVNGYRYLGLLAGVPFELVYPSAAWNPSQDILAVHEIGQNSISRDFAHMWEPCGIQLASHFILIFIHPPPRYVQQPFLMSFAGDLTCINSTPSPIPAHSSSSVIPSLCLILIV